VDRVVLLFRGAHTSFNSRTRARFVVIGLLWFALPVYLNISILIDVTESFVGPVCVELPDYYDMMQVPAVAMHFTVFFTVVVVVVVVAAAAAAVVVDDVDDDDDDDQIKSNQIY